MANDKNNTNELAADEDPTSELEAITFRHEHPGRKKILLESDAHTCDLEEVDDDDHESASGLRSDLRSRRLKVEKLQYDIAQLRAKWLGLDAELNARKELTTDLQEELRGLGAVLDRKNKLLRTRAATIKALKTEIRDRNGSYRELARDREQLRQESARLEASVAESENALHAAQSELATVRARHNDDAPHSHADDYADSLRRKLQDLMADNEAMTNERRRLERHIAHYRQSIGELRDNLASAHDESKSLREQLATANTRHEEEIRILRFELGEAQDTVAQTEELNGQLASDLIDTRGFKEELERMLCDSDEKSQSRIAELEREVDRLRDNAAHNQQQLEAKNEAINVLLGELARKTEQLDAIGEIEHAIHDIDERMSGRLNEQDIPVPPATRQAHGERLTRVLIGSIDQQEVRFPLFKDRLTIGRTDKNDIQLRAAYVSRRHAVVVSEQDTTRLIDWGSKNGVYVNSRRVKEHFLSNGDIITIGNARFRYEERIKREV